MTSPLFTYRISGNPGAIDSDFFLWNTPLCGKAGNHRNDNLTVFLIKDFFESATCFLKDDDYGILKKGIEFHIGKTILSSDIRYIDILLDKHGAFYHPSKISVGLHDGKVLFFVLNSAVSHAGLAIIKNEYKIMKLLCQRHSNALIPQVFGIKKFNTKKGVAGFFLAEWLNDFHEFHITSSTVGSGSADCTTIGLWEYDGTISKILSPDYCIIYEKASELLTEFYNPITFEQIFPWHHAAGDFVIKSTDRGFDVRLITVRNYGALFGTETPENMPGDFMLLYGLLFFLLNLSLRMRIDRVDGTGEYRFIDTDIISSVLKGFATALSRKKLPGTANGNTVNIFFDFLKSFDAENLYESFEMISNSYDKNAPETLLIGENLHKHSEEVFKKISML